MPHRSPSATQRVSNACQAGVMALVYQKALALNGEALPPNVTSGTIASHLAVAGGLPVALLIFYIIY